jgi:hypothetical protein
MTLETIQYITFAYGGYIKFALAGIGAVCVCYAFRSVVFAITAVYMKSKGLV